MTPRETAAFRFSYSTTTNIKLHVHNFSKQSIKKRLHANMKIIGSQSNMDVNLLQFT